MLASRLGRRGQMLSTMQTTVGLDGLETPRTRLEEFLVDQRDIKIIATLRQPQYLVLF